MHLSMTRTRIRIRLGATTWSTGLLLAAVTAGGCKMRYESDGEVKSLSAERGNAPGEVVNIALVIGAPNCGGECQELRLPGVEEDVASMTPLLRDVFGFEV